MKGINLNDILKYWVIIYTKFLANFEISNRNSGGIIKYMYADSGHTRYYLKSVYSKII